MKIAENIKQNTNHYKKVKVYKRWQREEGLVPWTIKLTTPIRHQHVHVYCTYRLEIYLYVHYSVNTCTCTHAYNFFIFIKNTIPLGGGLSRKYLFITQSCIANSNV